MIKVKELVRLKGDPVWTVDPKQTARVAIHITASGETTLEDCMEIMTENHFRHLPILEGDELVGIVSIRDLVAKLLMNKDALIIDLEKYISGKR
jgi:CBS domain-containing protein